MTKVLLTGYRGFVGPHLRKNLPTALLGDEQGEVNICDESALKDFFRKGCPEAVIHLAAQSNVPDSFLNPFHTYKVNFLGTLNLLSVLKEANFSGTFLYVSSGDIYGAVPEDQLPINEMLLAKPRNPYGVSKVAAEALCYQWSQTEKFKVVIARPFNHVGPGQGDKFVISSLAKQIIEIKLGKKNPYIEVGNIDVTRDFTDVRDVVKAYALLLKKGRNGETYNICSGTERSIRSILETLMDLAQVEVEIKESKERWRAHEQRRVFGSFEKLYCESGWKPGILFIDSLRDILKDWELRIS